MTSTTLAAALTASSQSVTLSSGTLTVGSLIAVDSEYLRVTERYSATAAKVQRGVNGSSSAAHDNGTDATIGAAWEFLTGPATPPPFGPADDALTAQGPSAAPAYAAGGGGGSILHQAVVTLANADIKAIGDGGTDVEIVAAPGANKALIIVYGFASLNSTAGAYTGVNASSGIVLATGGAFGTVISTKLAQALGAAGTQPIAFSPLVGTVGSGDLVSQLVDPSGVATNRNINITDWWAPGAYGGGHANNTLIVSVAYLLIDTTTGVFE